MLGRFLYVHLCLESLWCWQRCWAAGAVLSGLHGVPWGQTSLAHDMRLNWTWCWYSATAAITSPSSRTPLSSTTGRSCSASFISGCLFINSKKARSRKQTIIYPSLAIKRRIKFYIILQCFCGCTSAFLKTWLKQQLKSRKVCVKLQNLCQTSFCHKCYKKKPWWCLAFWQAYFAIHHSDQSFFISTHLLLLSYNT